jgi:predicted nucleic acid-binding protein
MKKVIVDTDILSMFAKIDALAVLVEFFGREHIGMTPAIADEASIPLQYGYDFPLQIIAQIPAVSLSQAVVQESIRLQTHATFLGHGEREAIAFCRIEGASFVTNDRIARMCAQEQGIVVFSLQALIRAIWLNGTRTRAETIRLLEQIKQADNLKISQEAEDKIFEQEDTDSKGELP